MSTTALSVATAFVKDLVAGTLNNSPRSAARFALQNAQGALRIADIVCGRWIPTKSFSAVDMAEDIEGALPVGHVLSITGEQWDAGTVEISGSHISGEFYRVRAGWHEWVIERTTEGGYGDDGTGTREFTTILAHGEAPDA